MGIGIGIGIAMGMGIGPGLVFVAQSGVQLAGSCTSCGSLTGEPGVLMASVSRVPLAPCVSQGIKGCPRRRHETSLRSR